MAQFELGSISTGTLRPEDLIPAFNNALTQIHDGHYYDIDEMMDDETGNAAEFGKQPSHDELQRRVVDRLMDELQDACPQFVYFGTHEGDGADFGFWPDSNSLDEALYNQTGAPHLDNVPSYCLPMHQDYPYGEITLEDDNVIVQLSDHGNVTVMDMFRNVLWSVV